MQCVSKYPVFIHKCADETEGASTIATMYLIVVGTANFTVSAKLNYRRRN